MKIILRTSYESLGKTGDVVVVKDGFARNFLVPQGIAYPANRNYLRMFENERKELEKKDHQAISEAESFAQQVTGIEIEYVVRINERGQMFGAITNAQIADSLAEQGHEVDKRKIALPAPIKTIGDHEVRVKLHGEVGFIVMVHVIPVIPKEEELDDEEMAAKLAEEAAAAELENAFAEDVKEPESAELSADAEEVVSEEEAVEESSEKTDSVNEEEITD